MPARLQAQVLVKDIWPGMISSQPGQFININNTLYFVADDGTHGRELWKTDGTPAGTMLVKDIMPNKADAEIEELINLDGTLYFSALEPKTKRRQLWRSNGTDAGTTVIYAGHKFEEVFDPTHLTVIGKRLYYVKKAALGGYDYWTLETIDNSQKDASVFYLFKYDYLEKDHAAPDNLTQANGLLYFTYKGDLWKTTATQSTSVVKKGIYAQSLTTYNGSLYFTAGINNSELWTLQSDGVTTQKVATPWWGNAIKNLQAVGQYMLFNAGAAGNYLWISAGTTASTHVLNTFDSPAHDFTNLSSDKNQYATYFIVGNGSKGTTYSVYHTDGIKTLKVTGNYTGGVHYIAQSKGNIYFTAAQGIYQITGGSKVTTLVAPSPFFSFNLFDANGKLYFSHDLPSQGFELYWLGPPGKYVPF